MENSAKIPLIVVVGPTAVGKTELTIDLALSLNSEVVSADSMQVYRGMDIGTAKPTLPERKGVPHHLIDVVDPDQEFNVADYVGLAECAINDIFHRGRIPIVSGGTGLYINALVDGFLFPESGKDPKIRQELTQWARVDKEGVFARLKEVDPETAARLHPNDVRRVIRALEVYLCTGEPISALQKKAGNPSVRYRPLIIGLTRERQELYDRINRRVDLMIEHGLIREVEELLRLYPHQPTALQALGYKEIASYLRGETTLEDAVYLLKRDTRRYAKRQLSWFRRDDRIVWFNLSENSSGTVIAAVLAQVEERL